MKPLFILWIIVGLALWCSTVEAALIGPPQPIQKVISATDFIKIAKLIIKIDEENKVGNFLIKAGEIVLSLASTKIVGGEKIFFYTVVLNGERIGTLEISRPFKIE
ncbi:MAG: hypothetical protein AB7D02_02325 [Candidatus Paceibacterota bacterium]